MTLRRPSSVRPSERPDVRTSQTQTWTISRTLLTVELWNLVQGYFVARPFRPWNWWKNWTLADISDTINSKVMKLYPKVLCDKTFKMMKQMRTSTQGQGHRVTLKCWKIELWLISRTLLTVELWNLTQRYYVTRPLKTCKWKWPWPKVKVTVTGKVKCIADTWVIVASPF